MRDASFLSPSLTRDSTAAPSDLSQDVFLSWIAKAASDKKTGEVEIFFVAFSMPGVSDIKQELEVGMVEGYLAASVTRLEFF